MVHHIRGSLVSSRYTLAIEAAVLLLAALRWPAATTSAQDNGVFRSARNLTWLNSATNESGCRVSADGLALFYHSDRSANREILVARRGDTSEEFGEPELVESPVNSEADDANPSLSADGLELFFASTRFGGVGGYDIWVAKREDPGEPFMEEAVLLPFNTSFDEAGTAISHDGLTLYFSSDRPGSLGGYDIYLASRASVKEDFGKEVEHLQSTINSSQNEWAPFPSVDESTLFFGRGDNSDLWLAHRAGPDPDFFAPLRLGSEVNSAFAEYTPSVTSDWPATGAKLYFSSCRDGSCDIWEATWTIVVDDLRCKPSGCGAVHLEWSNPSALEYAQLRVFRDGKVIASLDRAARDFTDTGASIGQHVYTVAVGYLSQTAKLRCTVEVECPATPFRRGDANGDGKVDISDASFILGWLFLGTRGPGCLAAAEVNGEAPVDLSDAVYLLGHLFLGSSPPPAPFPDCGTFEGPEGSECAAYEACES